MPNPFLDQRRVHGDLYQHTGRLVRRTASLHAAKIAGPDVADTVVDLLAAHLHRDAAVLDLGCGRGSTTLRLSEAFTTTVALDASAALLAATATRLAAEGARPTVVLGDFHHLPFGTRSVDGAVAAFCLYHSHAPGQVIAEIARCLRPGGLAVLVTKSQTSYNEIDQLIADCGLDRDAVTRPSLYSAFHSSNAADITATHLTVRAVVHHRHLFRFPNLAQFASYVATTPRYHFGALDGDPEAISAALRRRLPEQAVSMSSTVTYIVAMRP